MLFWCSQRGHNRTESMSYWFESKNLSLWLVIQDTFFVCSGSCLPRVATAVMYKETLRV